MGKNSDKAKLETEVKQAEANNLGRQDKADTLVEAEENKKPTGSICKATTQRAFNFEGDDGIFQFVDSHTVSNNLNHNIDRYFHPIYRELEKLNCVDRH